MTLETLLQLCLAGLTVGAIYALVALGFTMIFNVSGVVNFAQGEFVMLGGLTTWVLIDQGLPLGLAALAAVLLSPVMAACLYLFAIRPARGASVVTLIVITIGASILLQGLAQVVYGKNIHRYPGFSGDETLQVLGATLQPQSLWIYGGTLILLTLLWLVFTRTLAGKAVLATANNRPAAQLTGLPVEAAMLASFAVSAAIGAIGGVLITPISFTTYDAGAMLALKGFSAAILGGLGSPQGAVLGGLIVGLAETFGATLSSGYKDAIAFLLLLAVLFLKPGGLFGSRITERV